MDNISQKGLAYGVGSEHWEKFDQLQNIRDDIDNNPKTKYVTQHSHKLHPTQNKLIQATLKHPFKIMLAETETIQMLTVLIGQMKLKNVLDIGLFTGFSALSWALAIPEDGQVITMDIEDENYKQYGKPLVEEAGLAHKIDIRIQPALKTLDELIASGQEGKFDFAFLDADKSEYPLYYEKCMQLLRSGGLIAVDNALWNGEVMEAEKDDWAKAIDNVNKIIANDDRVDNVLLSISDGLHLAFKK